MITPAHQGATPPCATEASAVCLLPVSGVLFTSVLLCNTGFGEAHQWAQAHFLFSPFAIRLS